MNIKLTVKNALGKIVYCVISPTEDREKQLSEVVGCEPGRGFSISLKEKAIDLVDYFAGETRATFEILSEEETDLPVALHWSQAE